MVLLDNPCNIYIEVEHQQGFEYIPFTPIPSYIFEILELFKNNLGLKTKNFRSIDAQQKVRCFHMKKACIRRKSMSVL